MKGGNFIAYFLAGALPRLSMFVILFVLARQISIVETGLFVLVTTVGEILEMSTANWIRLFAQTREAGQQRLRPLRYGRLLVLALAGMGAALLLVLPAALIVSPVRFWAFGLCVGLYVVAFAALRTVLVIQQLTQNHTMFSRIELARGLLVLVAVLAAAYMPGATFVGPSVALALSTLLVALAGMWFARSRAHPPRFIARGYGTAGRYGAPIIADTVFGLVLMYFERFVLNQLLGPASVGVYAIAFALGRQPVDFIAAPLNNLTVTVLFATRAREGEERARKVQTGVSISLFVLCAGALTGIFMLRTQFAELFVKPEFRADTALLMPIIAASACVLVFKVFLYDNLFFMAGRNGLKLKAIIPAAIGGAIGSVVLIKAYGLAGAAFSSLLAAVLALAASVIATRTFFRFPMPFADLARISAVALLSGLVLKGATVLVQPLGTLAEVVAGCVLFCACYAFGLGLVGVSLRRLISTPWDPLADRKPRP